MQPTARIFLVRDFTELGQLFLSTAAGFRVVTLILIVLFMATVMIFLVNTVLLALVKRRREIGTAIAIGLSPAANVWILLGEMLVLVCVSWTLGSVLGIGIILVLHRAGIPGIIFMPEGRLLLDFSPSQLASALRSSSPPRRFRGDSPPAPCENGARRPAEGGVLMLAPRLALRNVFAHRQRSLIMLIVVGLTAFVVFLFMAFSDGQIENAQKGFLALLSPSADIAVYATGLKTAEDEGEDWKRTSTLSIRDYPKLLDEIRALPFVARACNPTTSLELDIFAGGRKYRNFLFRGVDPAQGWIVQDYIRMTRGAFFDESDTPQVILHEKTAATMQVRPGDTVTIVGKDLFGQVVVQDALFSGFFVPRQDMPYLIDHGFMNMAAYRLISGFSPDEAMSIFVDLKKGESRRAAIQELTRWAAGPRPGPGVLGLQGHPPDHVRRVRAAAPDLRGRQPPHRCHHDIRDHERGLREPFRQETGDRDVLLPGE